MNTMINAIIFEELERKGSVGLVGIGTIVKFETGGAVSYLFAPNSGAQDETLINAVSAKMDISVEEATKIISGFISLIAAFVKTNGSYTIDKIGVLCRDNNNVYYLAPIEMESVVSEPVTKTVLEVVNKVVESTESETDEPEYIEEEQTKSAFYEPELVFDNEQEENKEEELEEQELEEQKEFFVEEQVAEQVSELISEPVEEQVQEPVQEPVEKKQEAVQTAEKRRINEQFEAKRLGETAQVGVQRRLIDRVPSRQTKFTNEDNVFSSFKTAQQTTSVGDEVWSTPTLTVSEVPVTVISEPEPTPLAIPTPTKVVPQTPPIAPIHVPGDGDELVEEQETEPVVTPPIEKPIITVNDGVIKKRSLQDIYSTKKPKITSNYQVRAKAERSETVKTVREELAEVRNEMTDFKRDTILPPKRRGGVDWVMTISIIIILAGLAFIAYFYYENQALL